MTKEDEDDYLTYCSEAMFRIHILEQRLQRLMSMSGELLSEGEKLIHNLFI